MLIVVRLADSVKILPIQLPGMLDREFQQNPTLHPIAVNIQNPGYPLI
ncbi:MAG: hypothetical protein HC769_00585 [Cyanobacteria bacterium CRU_2_1]|nr:hypothetical protein [Cyanobacteria bacterium CRU_2_1]